MSKLITFDDNLYKLHMNPFRFCFTKEEFDVEQFVKDALEIMARPELNDKALANLLQSSIAWVVGQPLPVVQEMMQSPDGLKEVSERIEDVVSSSGIISHTTEDLDKDSKSVSTSQINDLPNVDDSTESEVSLIPVRDIPADPWEVDSGSASDNKHEEEDGLSASDPSLGDEGDNKSDSSDERKNKLDHKIEESDHGEENS